MRGGFLVHSEVDRGFPGGDHSLARYLIDCGHQPTWGSEVVVGTRDRCGNIGVGSRWQILTHNLFVVVYRGVKSVVISSGCGLFLRGGQSRSWKEGVLVVVLRNRFRWRSFWDGLVTGGWARRGGPTTFWFWWFPLVSASVGSRAVPRLATDGWVIGGK